MEKKRGRGQPEFRPTIEQRVSVEQMRYCGEPISVIARSLAISTPTLRKHFAVELADGHANQRRVVVGFLFKSAADGNVSAQKKLEDMGRSVDMMRAGPSRSEDASEERGPALGKKEAAVADAAAAIADGGKFAPRAGPHLSVVGGKETG